MGRSQKEFAQAVRGVSRDTLGELEQGRRRPQGPARVLLQVAAKHPEAVWEIIKSGGLLTESSFQAF